MQLTSLLVGALLPLGLLANPTPDAAAVDAPALDAPTLDARGEFARPQQCAIKGASQRVSCRRGPGTGYSVKQKLERGRAYPVWCVHAAQCITIGEVQNCGWHYIKELDCFVNGHYTDTHCTFAVLGSCGFEDDDEAADYLD